MQRLELYLIRHGETAWSLSGQHTGATDLPLTPRGEEEAVECGRQLRGIAFTRVLTSPRQRARRTCEIAGLGGRAEVTQALREWEYGAYEGLTLKQIHEQSPDWNIYERGCPGGETPGDVQERVDRLLSELRKEHGNIALFSHGHLSRAIAVRWAGLPIQTGNCLGSATGSISVLGMGSDTWPAILVWNRSPTFP